MLFMLEKSFLIYIKEKHYTQSDKPSKIHLKGHSISTQNQSFFNLQDAFMLKKPPFDKIIKGKELHHHRLQKYYFEDVGLRNARLNYRVRLMRTSDGKYHI